LSFHIPIQYQHASLHRLYISYTRYTKLEKYTRYTELNINAAQTAVFGSPDVIIAE